MKQYPKFKKGGNGDYPLTKQKLKRFSILGLLKRLVNPKVGKSYGYKIPNNFDIYESAKEIERVRADVIRGVFPEWFMQKHYPFKAEFGSYEFPAEVFAVNGLSTSDPKGLANAVHMDKPVDMANMVTRWLVDPMYGQSQNVHNWSPDHINFIETVADVDRDVAKAACIALIISFRMKSYFGLARPEEILGYNCTAYDFGCPLHSSAPAGHSGFSGGTIAKVIELFPDLTKRQLKLILDTAYSWAMFRSLAGVHYYMDNILGLMACGLEKYMRKDIVRQYKK